MSSKHSKDLGSPNPTGADDLKLIRGIGPQIAALLYDAGIHSYAQLASLSADVLVALLPDVKGLSAERINKQDWIGQARRLASVVAQADPDRDDPPAQGCQRYTTYAVELLVDEADEVRRTRVSHVQSGDEVSWAGWEQTRLVDFIVEHAGLSEQAGEFMRQAASGQVATSLPVVPANISGETRLSKMVTVLGEDDTPRTIIAQGQLFSVQLTLDLSNVAVPPKSLLDYRVIVRAKDLGNGSRQLVGQARGLVMPAETLSLVIESARLLPGTYRLEVAVALTLPSGEASKRTALTALLEGVLVQIY